MDKKNLLIIGLVIALLGVGVYAAVASKDAPTQNDSTAQSEDAEENSDTNTMSGQIKDALASGELFEVGDTVEYATRSIVVKSVEAKKSVVSYGQSYSADPGSKYLIVTFTETNISDAPFRSEAYALLSDDGKAYSSDASDLYYSEGTLVGETLNPNVPKTGTNVFVIPEDVTSVNFGSTSATTGEFVGVKLTF